MPDINESLAEFGLAIDVWPLERFKVYERNPRAHPEENIKAIVASIEDFGFKGAVLVDKDGSVIAGHGRIEAAKRNGLSKLPVLIATDLDKAKAKALRIADNKTAEMAEWNLEFLKADLGDLRDAGLDLSMTAFDVGEIAQLMSDGNSEEQDEAGHDAISIADALREKWQTERGQLWEIPSLSVAGRTHRIMCGDSTIRDDLQRLMQGHRADMMFADPPYGVKIGEKNEFLDSFQKAGGNLEAIAGDTLCKDELFGVLVRAFSTVREEACSDCCAVYVTAPQGGELGMMMMMMEHAGLPVRHVLNWVKNAPTFSLGRLDYEYQHEPILYTWTKTHKHYGAGQHKTSTWFIDKPRAAKEHPTMKPIELVVNAVLNSSNQQQNIIDPFLGSGTTILACEETGRLGFGMEIDPKYVAVSLERLSSMGLKPGLANSQVCAGAV